MLKEVDVHKALKDRNFPEGYYKGGTLGDHIAVARGLNRSGLPYRGEYASVVARSGYDARFSRALKRQIIEFWLQTLTALDLFTSVQPRYKEGCLDIRLSEIRDDNRIVMLTIEALFRVLSSYGAPTFKVRIFSATPWDLVAISNAKASTGFEEVEVYTIN